LMMEMWKEGETCLWKNFLKSMMGGNRYGEIFDFWIQCVTLNGYSEDYVLW
jgi:hypothetical protein